MTTSPLIQLQGVNKRFGGTIALSNVDLTIDRGTVHALVGENGAGKSTLGKIIAGVHSSDDGEMLVAGRPAHFRSPRQALDHGLTIVAQELSLVPARSVIENIYLGREDHTGPLVRRAVLRRRFSQLVEGTGIEVPRDAAVGGLSIAQQQKVEILRALARNAELIVMDEPTARLSAAEAVVLAEIIRGLRESGTTVVFVSHFLDEVLAVSDVITVMRDGKVIRTRSASEESRGSLIEGMIGRQLDATFPAKILAPRESPIVLQVRELTRGGAFSDISFDVRAGEIVVLSGLVGSGRSEVARAIYGADRATGSVRLDGRPLNAKHPVEAVRRGVAMIPESRKTQGLQQHRSVCENITLPYLAQLSRAGVVRSGMESRQTARIISAVGVRTSSPRAAVSTLSGGNQQKVLFARSLFESPRLLIADEPTRGVDVGAKRAIYDLLVGLAADGMAVLVISSELEEVLGLAHRVLVMRHGQLVAELEHEDVSERGVMHAVFGEASTAKQEE